LQPRQNQISAANRLNQLNGQQVYSFDDNGNLLTTDSLPGGNNLPRTSLIQPLAALQTSAYQHPSVNLFHRQISIFGE